MVKIHITCLLTKNPFNNMSNTPSLLNRQKPQLPTVGIFGVSPKKQTEMIIRAAKRANAMQRKMVEEYEKKLKKMKNNLLVKQNRTAKMVRFCYLCLTPEQMFSIIPILLFITYLWTKNCITSVNKDWLNSIV